MDELIAVCREIDRYTAFAADAEPVGTIAFPIALAVKLRRALAALQDYNEAGTYHCMICREEPQPHPGMTCPRCQRNRQPRPSGVAPWMPNAASPTSASPTS